jgi:hypothetical protein
MNPEQLAAEIVAFLESQEVVSTPVLFSPDQVRKAVMEVCARNGSFEVLR